MSGYRALNLITNVGNYVKPDEEMPLLKGVKSWVERDRKFEMVKGKLAVSGGDRHIIPEYTPISDQGRIGSCVANAWCDAMEILMGVHYGENKVIQLSRLFSYWTSRLLHDGTGEDGGTYLRACAHQLRKVGVIPESLMPYTDRQSAVVGSSASPRMEHYTQASNNRLNGFYRLDEGSGKLDQAELSIRSNHPIIFAVPVARQFQRARALETFDAPFTDVVGHHAMIIVGVKIQGSKRYWLVRNSWGKEWGDDGHCWITDNYLGMSRDTWVGTVVDWR